MQVHVISYVEEAGDVAHCRPLESKMAQVSMKSVNKCLNKAMDIITFESG
jgi:hypothetical protein